MTQSQPGLASTARVVVTRPDDPLAAPLVEELSRDVADRLTVFRNGETVAAHDVHAVSDDEIIAEMLGRRLDRLYPERVDTATGRVALKVRDLSVGDRLRDASFDLREGEVLGVGGLQGHGQRELFQVGRDLNAQTGSLSPLVAAGAFYLMLTIPLTHLVNFVDNRLRHGRPTVDPVDPLAVSQEMT